MRQTLLYGTFCVLSLSGCGISGTSTPSAYRDNIMIEKPETQTISVVNPRITAETASLLGYLHSVSGRALLFGHQHDTTQGLTLRNRDSTQDSDVFSAVGDYPAVYGWDTLSIVGSKPEGDIVRHVKAAYQRGGIVTISTHLPNPTAQSDAWDTSPTVEYILPGGKDNDKYRAQLDQIADWAHQMTDPQGRPIPMILRILHENTGSWFWWGAAYTSPEQYKNLFRYTVDYLRDVRGVNNLLFSYSPSDDFNGSELAYLERYPGDQYVDVLGFDSYGPAKDNQAWRDMVVKGAATIARLAEARGKVAALTEVGLQPDDLAKGNKDPDWYTSLLSALQADPDARKIAYMLVWTNARPEHYWVPVQAQHDGMFEDFQRFYASPVTLFNRDLHDVYNRSVKTKATEPDAYLMTPTRLQTLRGVVTLRARLLELEGVNHVEFVVQGGSTILLQTTDGLYYEGELDTRQLSDNRSYEATLVTLGADGLERRQDTRFIVANSPPVSDPALIDHFEQYYGLNDLLSNSYSPAGDYAKPSLVKLNNAQQGYGMQVDFKLGTKGYSGLTHAIPGADWSGYQGIRLWLDPDQQGQRLVVQLMVGGAAWEAYLIMGSHTGEVRYNQVNKYGDGTIIRPVTQAGWITIPFTEFVSADWSPEPRPLSLNHVASLSFYVNALGEGVVVDNGRYTLDGITLQ